MAIVVSNARRLRFEYQAKEGRPITIEEVAEAVGVDRKRLTQIELGKQDRISMSELLQLCAFYSEKLGRQINIGDVLEIREEHIRAPEVLAFA